MHDALAIFSDSQAITATADSTNAVQFTGYKGQNTPIPIVCKVVEDFTNCTSLSVAVQECATEGGSYVTIATYAAVLLAGLVAGAEFALNVTPSISKPWIQLRYTVAGSAPDAGKIYAAVSMEPKPAPYRDGLYISPRNPTGAI
jgi:hypothetical protein